MGLGGHIELASGTSAWSYDEKSELEADVWGAWADVFPQCHLPRDTFHVPPVLIG